MQSFIVLCSEEPLWRLASISLVPKFLFCVHMTIQWNPCLGAIVTFYRLRLQLKLCHKTSETFPSQDLHSLRCHLFLCFHFFWQQFKAALVLELAWDSPCADWSLLVLPPLQASVHFYMLISQSETPPSHLIAVDLVHIHFSSS